MGGLPYLSGVYAALSLEVARRRREVGLRLALGATTRHIAKQALRSGLTPAVAGAIAGALASLWASSFLEHLLVGVQPRDLVSIGAGVLLVAITAGLACLLPALRASRTDPARVLRAE